VQKFGNSIIPCAACIELFTLIDKTYCIWSTV